MAAFQKVLKKSELAVGRGKCVELQGKRIAVFNVDGNFFAIDDFCTHAGASLADGAVVNSSAVECPWHGAQFDLKTGEALTPPAYDKVKAYNVRLHGEDIEIETD